MSADSITDFLLFCISITIVLRFPQNFEGGGTIGGRELGNRYNIY